MTVSRRRFLQLGALAGAAFLVPSCLASFATSGSSAHRKLVLLQLTGGNDGLNTVVPYSNDIYYKSRPTIAVARNAVLTLTDDAGFHPGLRRLANLYHSGWVSIINNVGYAGAHRSHHKCLSTWHTASTCKQSSGWLERHFNQHQGNNAPNCFSQYNTPENLPASHIANASSGISLREKLRKVATMINEQEDQQAFFVAHGGYDTHVHQVADHSSRLAELDAALHTMVQDLRKADQFQHTMILVYSEFGRRVSENQWAGTDHGTANSVFIISGGLSQAGLYNPVPDLSDLEDGDLMHSVDFRQVYATILDGWLYGNSEAVLGAQYARLGFV